MKLRPYPEYKDSGVEWLGKLPLSWNEASLSRVLADPVTDGPHSTPEFIDEGIPFLSVDGIQDGELVFDGCRYISETDHIEFSKKAAPRKDDILMGKAASIGKIARVKTEMTFSIWSPLALIRVNQAECNPLFLEFQMKSQELQSQILLKANSNTQLNIGMKDIQKLRLALPPIQEQASIATYLELETGKLDTLIAKQEHLIELLQEKRQAIISHTVTKGLNSDAKMKDSSVEWLGMVPEHWKAIPTKQIFHLVVEPADDDNDFELLSIYTDIGVRPRKDLEAKGNKATTTDGYLKVKKNDFIVNKLLAWMGAIGLSVYEGVTSPAYDILRAHKKIDPRYYDYLFRCGVMFIEFKKYSRGIMDMRLRLYFEEFGQLYLPFPTCEEQTYIADFLDMETNKIDSLIEKAKRSIELAKEHRTALISAAVTGKIDVRDYVNDLETA